MSDDTYTYSLSARYAEARAEQEARKNDPDAPAAPSMEELAAELKRHEEEACRVRLLLIAEREDTVKNIIKGTHWRKLHNHASGAMIYPVSSGVHQAVHDALRASTMHGCAAELSLFCGHFHLNIKSTDCTTTFDVHTPHVLNPSLFGSEDWVNAQLAKFQIHVDLSDRLAD